MKRQQGLGRQASRRPTILAALVALLVSASGLSATAGTADRAMATPAASATTASSTMAQVDGADFNAGLIISDQLFFSRNALTQAQIQTFLDLKIGTCANSNCLNVYRVTTASRLTSTDNVCEPYVGAANEAAAAIIYKVQVACGVSAKVLLVTLQKEQGLVTATSPTDTKLRIAMGYGCPDTAACDTKYYGLYNQLYSAAWQFRHYSYPRYAGNFRPGTFAVRYHPNADCGTKTVNIQNNATAALYNYTPYTPNAAALANIGGSAPPCGSYGNRNFWVYFTSWFGSTLTGAGDGAITEAYAAAGGASGPLGAVVSAPSCGYASYCSRTYTNGIIGWSAVTGAFPSYGPTLVKYTASGGTSSSIGYPIVAPVAITGPNGDGISQAFENAQIVSSASGAFILRGPIRTAHASMLWVRGPLGWPTTDQICVTSVTCAQAFQFGALSLSSGTTKVSDGVIGTKYLASGGPAGSLGPALGAITAITGPHGDGTSQAFYGGQIVSSSAGTFVLSGAIRTAHAGLAWVRGSLGWPTSDAICGSGTCTQLFQGGAIASVGATTYVSDAVIGAKYIAAGGPSGPIGVPIGAITAITGPNGNGQSQAFRNAQIVSSTSGTFVLSGTIRAKHAELGWVRGALGWPTADAVCDTPGNCTQAFQYGTVFANVGEAAYVVPSGPIGAKYVATGGPTGPLGAPTGAIVAITGPNGNGQGQAYQNGQIVSSSSGTFVLSGAIRTKHASLSWVRGSLGWPTADATCASGTCTQLFQGGAIAAVGATTYASDGAIGRKYLTAGGPAGSVGVPILAIAAITGPNGNGQSQAFQNAQIVSSTSGTFVLSGVIRAKHAELGWVRGALGWPTADAICSAGTCSQQFQHGKITATGSAATVTY